MNEAHVPWEVSIPLSVWLVFFYKMKAPIFFWNLYFSLRSILYLSQSLIFVFYIYKVPSLLFFSCFIFSFLSISPSENNVILNWVLMASSLLRHCSVSLPNLVTSTCRQHRWSSLWRHWLYLVASDGCHRNSPKAEAPRDRWPDQQIMEISVIPCIHQKANVFVIFDHFTK